MTTEDPIEHAGALVARSHGGLPKSRWWTVGGSVTVAILIGLALVSERTDLVESVTVLRSASLGWVAASLIGALFVLVCIAATHEMAQRAAGLPDGGHLFRPTLRANMLNLVTKSNGLAGLVAFTADATARRRSKGSTIAAYLAAGLAQQIGFVIVAGGSFVLMIVDGRLRRIDVIAAIALVVYVAANSFLVVMAFRDRDALRRVSAIPSRLLRRLRRRPNCASHDTTAADELFDAAQILRRSPASALRVLVPAIGGDLTLALLLWCALRAVGADASLLTALVAFTVSIMFGIISFLPAGLGFVEVSSAATLIASGVQPARAAAAVALYRIGELWLPLVLGVVVSTTTRRRRWRPSLRAAAAVGSIASGIIGLTAAASPEPGRLRFGPALEGVVDTDRYVVVVVAVALCSVGLALWRGKRWAVLAFLSLGLLLVWSTSPGERGVVTPSLLVTASIVVFGIRSFRVRSDVARARSALLGVIARQFVILVYGIAGLYLLDNAFRQQTTLAASMRDGLRLLFALPANSIEPVTMDGRIFIESVRIASLASVITFLMVALVPLIRPRERSDRHVARLVVERYATNGLAPFVLDDDKDLVVDDNGLVSYHLAGSVALALGGPIGSDAGAGRALDRFGDRCESNGWTPAFHQVGDDDRELLESRGFQFHYIGADAIVPVRDFDLSGPHFKSLRSTLRKLERRGRRVEELVQPIDDATMAKLSAVSDSWMASGGHRERAFTLGRFDPDYLRSTRVLVVRVDPSPNQDDPMTSTDGADSTDGCCGDIEAFVNMVPSFQGRNANFDLMRHRAGSINGVMDLLFVSMIERCRDEGMDGLDLGLAPLAEQSTGPGSGWALRTARRHGDRWFHFDGLYDFKNKWQPEWTPRYVATRSPYELPHVMRAVQTAGELPHHSRLSEHIGRIVRRFPLSIGLGGFIVWLMLVTGFDHDLHVLLLRTFGLSWIDLSRLQLWRLFTSSLIQSQSGIVRANFVLVLTALPFAEWRLGSRHTAALFWFCDMMSATTVLLSIRVLTALGSDLGSSHLVAQDAGSSSALYGIVGGLLSLIPSRRRRIAVFIVICTIHLGLFAIYREVFDLQHLVATVVGFGLTSYWSSERPKPAGRATATSSAQMP